MPMSKVWSPPSQVKGFSRSLLQQAKLFCHRLVTSSLLGNTERVKSRENFTKVTRDRRVEISEVHHGCIKTLHFGNQVDGGLGTELIAKRV